MLNNNKSENCKIISSLLKDKVGVFLIDYIKVDLGFYSIIINYTSQKF